MLYQTDYTNYKVLIRNEVTGESIAQAKIIEYNKRQLSIFIDASDFINALNLNKLILLIFTPDSIHVYGGVARKSFNSRRTEISMFQGKEHDDRSAKRYPTNINATISNIFFPEDNETVHHTFDASVLNLSASGVLVQTAPDEIEVNTSFILNLDIAGSPTLIKCLVVRVAKNDEGESASLTKFGCKFLSVETKA